MRHESGQRAAAWTQGGDLSAAPLRDLLASGRLGGVLIEEARRRAADARPADVMRTEKAHIAPRPPGAGT